MHPIRLQYNRIMLIIYSSYSQLHTPDNAATVSVLGREYKVDSSTTVTPTILGKVHRQLHNQMQHPIEIIKRRIVSHFSRTCTDSNGHPLFESFDTFSPVVSLEQNFDSLGVPLDHVTRSRSDNYYINRQHMLRAHTSAHQRDTIRLGHSRFLVTGDVYRRDEIDTRHYPVFHQMEGVELFRAEELFGPESNSALFDPSRVETQEKQAEHSLAAVAAIEANLKSKLESLMRHLFGRDLRMRWVGTYFPFTHPSYELEIYWNERWLEVLGSGIMRHRILEDGGVSDRAGYAFGLGLERLAMILFSIPDIRLFWSRDHRFLNQFIGLQDNQSLKFKPFSVHPPAMRDISLWVHGAFEYNDFHEIVRDAGDEWVENVELLEEYKHPETDRKSLCFRITYRCMERTLLGTEVQELHSRITDRLLSEMSVSIR